MIRNGILGDVTKLMPLVEGIDKNNDIDLSYDGEKYATEDELKRLNNVMVPALPGSNTDSYVSSDTVIGSAGNSVIDEDEPEAQLGSVDDGVTEGDPMLDGSMKMSLSEGVCEEYGSIIDNGGSNLAQDIHDESTDPTKQDSFDSQTTVDKAKELFDQFSFQPKTNVKFDVDSYGDKSTVSTEPLKRIPKGW